MRVGILASSYLVAFKVYEQLHDLPDCELFVVLSPLPHRSAWLSILANFARMIFSSITPSHWQLSSVPSNRRVVFLPNSIDHETSVSQLLKMKLDVGLDQSGVNYGEHTTKAFRFGVLKVRMTESAERAAVSTDTAFRLKEPVNVTVFFVDPRIRGGLPVVSEELSFSECRNLKEANRALSDSCAVFFRKALMALRAVEGTSPFDIHSNGANETN
jgi:hypothetical protein